MRYRKRGGQEHRGRSGERDVFELSSCAGSSWGRRGIYMTMPKEEPVPELVSRAVQAGIGLFTGVTVYNTAFGGLFALVFALAYRRMGDFGPRTTAALLARTCRLTLVQPIAVRAASARRTRAVPTPRLRNSGLTATAYSQPR